MKCRKIIWALTLAIVVVGCAILLFIPLQRGTDVDPARTAGTIEPIAEEAVLEILSVDLDNVNEVKRASDAKVEQLTEDAIQGVSDEAAGQIATVTSGAVQGAAIDIRDSAVNSLLPELEAIDIPRASETTQEIVESALGNLTLEPSEVEDRTVLESEITAVVGLALAEVSEEITASDREALEEATVNVLSASIADGVEIAKDSAVRELPNDARDEVNEQPTGRLSGSVDTGFFSASDIGFLSIVAAVGAMALEQLLRFITKIVS